MKKFLVILFIVLSYFSLGQVLIDDNPSSDETPHKQALLELRSNTKGFLLPRINGENDALEIEGMLFFDTSGKCFKAYDGEEWQVLGKPCNINTSTKVSFNQASISFNKGDETGKIQINYENNSGAILNLNIKTSAHPLNLQLEKNPIKIPEGSGIYNYTFSWENDNSNKGDKSFSLSFEKNDNYSIEVNKKITITIQEDNVSEASDLYISEYGEGSSNNKYLEIYNGTGTSIDLEKYKIWKLTNGGNWPESEIPLNGILENGQILVIYNPKANEQIKTAGDLHIGSSKFTFNGNDAIGLAKEKELIDQIGEEGPAPIDGWAVAGVQDATKDHVLVRKSSVTSGSTDWSVSAGTNEENSEWKVLPQDDYSSLGNR